MLSRAARWAVAVRVGRRYPLFQWSLKARHPGFVIRATALPVASQLQVRSRSQDCVERAIAVPNSSSAL